MASRLSFSLECCEAKNNVERVSSEWSTGPLTGKKNAPLPACLAPCWRLGFTRCACAHARHVTWSRRTAHDMTFSSPNCARVKEGPGSDVISWEAHREPPGHRTRL